MSAVEIIERGRRGQPAMHEAHHDALTGLPNRQLFLERLRYAVAASGGVAARVAVLYLDLDGFHTVNEDLGEEAADALLLVAGRRLSRAIRPSDTAARFGGDEFAVLLEGISHPTEAMRAGERLIAALSAPCALDGRQVRVTVSAGIAVSDGSSRRTHVDAYLHDAGAALSRAKASGKGRAVTF